ncbi:MAG: hypothetical protein NPIRA05_04940 [Nitrospirales bacterium]|nr:MAG: hypothetical protein NPIRA05_04940 [Nitrospirales bacterium]
MNKRINLLSFALIFLVSSMSALLVCPTSTLSALPEKDFWLITPEEAAMKPAAPDTDALDGEPLSEIGREMLEIGPIVEIVKPNTENPIGSPVEVLINFKERLAKINLASLTVEVEKFINIDITDRIKPYVTDQGIHIPDAPLPSGDHSLILYIEDTKGNPTELSLTIRVA